MKESKPVPELIVTTDIQMEKGYIYYCMKDENGNLQVLRAKVGRRPKKV
jgi:hypothetical protein